MGARRWPASEMLKANSCAIPPAPRRLYATLGRRVGTARLTVASVPSVPGSRDGPVLVRLGGVPRPAHQYPRAVGNGETTGDLGVGPESPTLGT